MGRPSQPVLEFSNQILIGSRSLWGGEEREEERGGRQVCGESCEETENEGQFRVMEQLQVKLSYVPSVLNAALHWLRTELQHCQQK